MQHLLTETTPYIAGDPSVSIWISAGMTGVVALLLTWLAAIYHLNYNDSKL